MVTNEIKIRAALTSVFFILAVATFFFHHVEGWDWVSAYYFSVVTMATVGYGDFAPQTDAGKIGATILIFFGIGALAVLIQLLAERFIDLQAHRIANAAKRHASQKHHYQPPRRVHIPGIAGVLPPAVPCWPVVI